MLSFIWAEDKNHGIAKNGNIPWHNKNDMSNFKKLTQSHIVVMGINTFKSLNNDNGLKNRVNIVITHSPKDYQSNESVKFIDENRLDKLIKLWHKTHIEVFIIGGQSIFELINNKVHPKYLYKTIIDDDYQCDKFMINNINYQEYHKLNEEKLDDKTTFIKYERNKQ